MPTVGVRTSMNRADDLDTSSNLLRKVCGPTNEDAWRTFVCRYQPFIEDVCRSCRLDPDAAEEVTQRVLAHLVRKMKGFTYDPSGSFRGWLATVVRRKVLDFVRELRQPPGDQASGDAEVQELLEQVAAPPWMDPASSGADEEEHPLLQGAKAVQTRVQARVRPLTWQAFWLLEIEELPGREVSKRLGISIAKVHVYAGRVRRRLRQEGEKLLRPEEPGSTPQA